MKNIIRLIFTLIIFNSCSSNKREINPSFLEDTSNSKIDRALHISESYSFQSCEHEYYNKCLFDTLLILIKDSKDLNDIKLVRQEAKRVIDTLHFFHRLIVHNTGGYEIKTRYKNGQDLGYIDTIFIKPNGPADNIELILKQYSDCLDSVGFNNHNIAPIGEDNPLVKHNKNLNTKGFSYLYFKNANVIEASNVLNYLAEEVLNTEERYYTSILIKK